ncbi:MAG: GC-type dockerin domain-anchored protein [Phycisphaerales bacterium]|nr:GC-type dockerin domain-anchored protein [Phycisphaerales bacterium]
MSTSAAINDSDVQNSGLDSDLGLVYEEKPTFREVSASIDSGVIRVTADQAVEGARALQVPIWSQVVEMDDADWIRLRFADIQLAKSTQEVRESYLRISSLEDGYEQYLDVRSLEEWSNSSAYFNGNAVLVELMASPNMSNQINRVQVVGMQVSDPVSQRSICFSTDDRVLSSDPRDGRLMPIGCSVWLFGEHGNCFMTAGHCGTSAGQVVQFNVPLSSSGGGTRNPPPQDQYAVDGSSVQSSSSIFIGNDWSYFGTFDNSTTGLSPLSAQGDSHVLATSIPPVDGRPIRITGYGSTSSPVPATWNQVQKTHVGPLVSFSGNTVRYRTDTTGGNSGSAILDDSNNTSIGIHTNAGCGSSGGSNQGTSLFNSGLQDALANPMGICMPRSIQASLLFEPTFVSPAGGDQVTVNIDNFQGHSVVGSPMMFVDSGSGFVGTPMSASGSDAYVGAFSAVDCGTPLSYYFSIEDEEGTIITIPENGASAAFSTIALEDLTIAFDDDFETDEGWMPFNTGGTGDFRRVIPANHGFSDPPTDADGSSRCFVTGHFSNEDVDGGSVALLSPLYDLTGLDSPVMRMSLWMIGSAGDSMTIEVSDTAGAIWVPVDTVLNTSGWMDVAYNIEDYVSINLAFRMRVFVTDGGADSLVEGGVDAFRIATELCSNGCPADMNGDGVLNFFDVSAYLSAFGAQDASADFNGDGVFNFFDVSSFLSAFSDGCP